MVTPGPKYKLPTTTGYDDHDVTKTRYPAYSVLGKRFAKDGPEKIVPGPKYMCDKVTRNGPMQSPNAVVSRRLELLGGLAKCSPGPGKYYPSLKGDGRYKSSREAPFGTPYYHPSTQVTPGPKYKLPEITGKAVIDMPNVPSWVFTTRTNFGSSFGTAPYSPGPGRYAAPNMDAYLKRAPTPMLAGRTGTNTQGIKPGPKYLGDFGKIRAEAPSWSFGVRHSWKQTNLRLPEDGGQYYGF